MAEWVRRMNKQSTRTVEKRARQWAVRLRTSVQQVLAKYPNADPDNVRHTLILLELPPLERLKRSLIRGRALAKRK